MNIYTYIYLYLFIYIYIWNAIVPALITPVIGGPRPCANRVSIYYYFVLFYLSALRKEEIYQVRKIGIALELCIENMDY